jgi:hypothetical protein
VDEAGFETSWSDELAAVLAKAGAETAQAYLAAGQLARTVAAATMPHE